MSERYVDPNSGAAPQPGGFALGEVGEDVDDPNEEHDAGNVTMPEDARPFPEQEEDEPVDQGKEELPDELIRSRAYDTELQNQAAPLGPQPGVTDRDDDVTPAGSYLGAGIEDPVAALAEQSEGSEESGGSEGSSEEEESEEYDPADHNVDDVVAYVEENPDQRDAVRKAEESGKNRSTLLDRL